MKYSSITSGIIHCLQKITGEQYVLTEKEDLQPYSHDETENLFFFPEVVVKPSSAEEIAEIMKLCNRELIAVTPRGAGTGLSGGALPVHGGIVIATERLNKILEIDERNLQATVEPGVINQVFQNAVIEKGLFYPPDPASRDSCFLGGNIAECAGGPRAVKYGVTRDYVLNLEVVLPSGEIIWTGANTLKNSTGYNLTQLFTGSEGTLGIVTKIVFKLLPYPSQTMLLLASFASAEKACESVSAVFKAGNIPSALEFMEKDAVDLAAKYTAENELQQFVNPQAQAYLLIETDGNDTDVLFRECEKIAEIMNLYECSDILFADTSGQKEKLWKMRRCLGEAVKSHSIYKEEDTVVPRAELPRLLKGIKYIGKKYGFQSVCYGHAGDGNLHVNIIKGEMSDDEWNNKVPQGIREIFQLCVELKGTISGEHGIGWVQKNYLNIAMNETQIQLQRGIKKLFDPNGILNPGKIFCA